MKIFLILDQASLGGVSMRTLRQAEALSKSMPDLDVKVQYMSNLNSGLSAPDNIEVKKFNAIKFFQEIWRQDKVFLFIMSGSLFLKFLPIKLLNTKLNIFVFQAVPLHLPEVKGFQVILRVLSAKIFYRFATKIITVSHELASELSTIYRLKNVSALPNPVIENRLKSDFKLPIITKNKVRALAVGRLHFQKDYPLLLQAIKITNIDIELDIYGDGNELKNLRAFTNSLGLSDKVKFLGHKSEIRELYKNYDIFLMTSRWEGLPSAMIEALYSGIRVCAIACPTGPREIAERIGATELVHERTPAAFAIGIKNCLSSEYVVNFETFNEYSMEIFAKRTGQLIFTE